MEKNDNTPQRARPPDQLAKLRLRRAAENPTVRRPRRRRVPISSAPAAASAPPAAGYESVLGRGLGLDDPEPDDVLDTLADTFPAAAAENRSSSRQGAATAQEITVPDGRDVIGERLRHYHEHTHSQPAPAAPRGSAALAADTPTLRPRRERRPRRPRPRVTTRSLRAVVRGRRGLAIASTLIVLLAAGFGMLTLIGSGRPTLGSVSASSARTLSAVAPVGSASTDPAYGRVMHAFGISEQQAALHARAARQARERRARNAARRRARARRADARRRARAAAAKRHRYATRAPASSTASSSSSSPVTTTPENPTTSSSSASSGSSGSGKAFGYGGLLGSGHAG